MRNTNAANVSALPKIVNGVAVDDLFTTIDAIKASPRIAKFIFRVRNQWADGGQNSSTVDTFYGAGQELNRTVPFILEADEPAVLLGKDKAANAGEYLLHALAACLTTSIVYHGRRAGSKWKRWSRRWKAISTCTVFSDWIRMFAKGSRESG